MAVNAVGDSLKIKYNVIIAKKKQLDASLKL